jgi:DNA-binding MarR family transcriptional regulator
MASNQTSRPAALGPQLSNAELAAWRGFLRTHHEMIASLDRELERRHGLPLTSYEVLLQIADSPTGTLRMSDIAERVLLSRSGLTRLVDRLERDGLVRRRTCPSDLRGQNAELTERGREVFADARTTHLAGVRRHFLERFDEHELETLGGLWARFGDVAGAC